MVILDSGREKRARQFFAVEMRISSGAGKASDVNESGNLMRLENLVEVVSRPRGVTDSPDRYPS